MATTREVRRRRPKPLLMQVNVRLYTDDVEAIKAEARAVGDTEWQPRLRRLVRNARKSKGVLR